MNKTQSKPTDVLATFLTNHKRGCLANQGRNCTCGLYDAREQFQRLTGDTWNEASERYYARLDKKKEKNIIKS